MEAVAHNPKFARKVGVPSSVGKEMVAHDAQVEECAGILLVTPGRKYLLLHKPDEGVWVQPGGHLRNGESALQAATRETAEETGRDDFEQVRPFREGTSNGVHFVTYTGTLPTDEPPSLTDEHDDWGYFAADALPSDTHPEVAKSIALLDGTETDIAKAVASGVLLSPQVLESSWLFDVRITGTGTAYRRALDEFVYRPPENFLTPDFVERCNGLPVVYEHPKSGTIDADEFHRRVIGAIVLAYIRGDEVRGVARVYDPAAAQAMLTDHPSTSPAVVFRDADAQSVSLSDGSTLLVEGIPSRLDHLAICAEGVWDKNQQPSGVSTTSVGAMN